MSIGCIFIRWVSLFLWLWCVKVILRNIVMQIWTKGAAIFSLEEILLFFRSALTEVGSFPYACWLTLACFDSALLGFVYHITKGLPALRSVLSSGQRSGCKFSLYFHIFTALPCPQTASSARELKPSYRLLQSFQTSVFSSRVCSDSPKSHNNPN